MSRVGFLGGGQLGRMAGQAGISLGMDLKFWDPAADVPARVTGEHICASYDDENALQRFVSDLDFVTYEFENVPAGLVETLEQSLPVRPGSAALRVSQDRVLEKEFFNRIDVPTCPWRRVDSEADLIAAFDELSQVIVKTRRFGYDGKGQRRAASHEDCRVAITELAGQPLIAEKVIPFSRELSILGVRAVTGEIRTWPLVENEHRNGILHRSIAPALTTTEVQARADSMIRRILEELDYVGVLALELFDVDGELLANEMAPRVHNSGHWSIEGAITSQFENHLRAVAGLPLGSTELRFPAVMINCIGAMPSAADVLAIPCTHLHDYGKLPRENRKVGHVTICDETGDPSLFYERVDQVGKLVEAARIEGN